MCSAVLLSACSVDVDRSAEEGDDASIEDDDGDDFVDDEVDDHGDDHGDDWEDDPHEPSGKKGPDAGTKKKKKPDGGMPAKAGTHGDAGMHRDGGTHAPVGDEASSRGMDAGLPPSTAPDPDRSNARPSGVDHADPTRAGGGVNPSDPSRSGNPDDTSPSAGGEPAAEPGVDTRPTGGSSGDLASQRDASQSPSNGGSTTANDGDAGTADDHGAHPTEPDTSSTGQPVTDGPSAAGPCEASAKAGFDLINKECVTCHSTPPADGAPSSFDTLEKATEALGRIYERADQGTMPPFRTLSDTELAPLREWVRCRSLF